MRRVSFRILLFVVAFAVGYGVFYLWLDWNTPEVKDEAINNSFQNMMVYAPPLDGKPNPALLLVLVDKNRAVTINQTNFGYLDNPATVINKLKEVFMERKNFGLFKTGTEQIEKAVVIGNIDSITSADFLILVEALDEAGANPIQLATNYLTLIEDRQICTRPSIVTDIRFAPHHTRTRRRF